MTSANSAPDFAQVEIVPSGFLSLSSDLRRATHISSSDNYGFSRLRSSRSQYLCSTVEIGWSDRVSSVRVGNPVLDAVSVNIQTQRIKLSKLRWLGYMLGTANIRPPYLAIFSVIPTERKKPREGQ